MGFTFNYPNYTIGEDAYSHIEEVCFKYGKTAVVIGGKTAISKARPYLEEALKDSQIKIVDYIWYGGEASDENAHALSENDIVKTADMIFAVGGGKAIDTCKEVHIITSKPLFTFPTIASTCAATTKIAIMYYPSGVSKETLVMDRPPIHTFINTRIIANAPSEYLWAGMGDTIAKHYEVAFSCRNRDLDYLNSMGLQLAPLTSVPLIKYGAKAYQDIKNHLCSIELEEVILGIIVSTGLVSVLVDHKYNTALAHAMYYGFTLLDEIKEKHLHGEVVSYGVLVQLMVDNNIDEFNKVYEFNKQLNLPLCLGDMDVSIDHPNLDKVISKAKNNSALEVIPYDISEEMIMKAIIDIENYKKVKK